MGLRLFLSATSDPYKSLRPTVSRELRESGFTVVYQEEFVEIGVNTLVKLAKFIEHESDIVVHLAGSKVGSVPSEDELRGLLEHCDENRLRQRFPELFKDDRFRRVTYTQWEAWLGWLYRKDVFLFEADDGGPTTIPADAPSMTTSEHMNLIRGRCGWSTKFTDEHSLVVGSLKSLARYLNQTPVGANRPFHLPYSSIGDLFTGRDDFLATLRENFLTRKSAQVIHGVGGVGKTRVAVEYALRFRDDYAAVLMVNGDSAESLRSSLAQLANVLHPDLDPAATDDIREKKTLDWLRRHSGWLMLIDNADTVGARDAIVSRLSQWNNGQALITARFGQWPRSVEAVELNVLSKTDGANFLLKATTRRRLAADDADQAKQMAGDDLDGLCLALEQAAAYINERAITLADYRDRWAKNQKDARTWADNVLMQYHPDSKERLSVATTWLTTFAQLSPEARTLLQMFAWLAPDPIPQGLVDHPEMTKQWQSLTGESNRDVELALAELRRYSLLSRQPDDPSAGQIHRVVQLITRDRLGKQEQPATLHTMLEAIDEYVPDDSYDVRTWPILEPLAPHLKSIITFAEAADIAAPTTRLLNQFALFLYAKALHKEAEPLMRSVLAIDEKSYGAEHPTIATDLNNLALLLQATNRLAAAESLMRRALVIDEKSYGDEHPQIACGLSNLASLLMEMNHLGEAETLMRRALAIDEKWYGPGHTDVARDLNNLALLLQATNRLGEAEPLLRRALAIDEKSYGAEHPRVAADFNNLASLLYTTNRLAEAEPLMRRALAIDEKWYGSEHPDVAIRLTNLAQLLMATNRLEEAEPLMRRALAIYEKSYGAEHSRVAGQLNNLAQLLKAANRLEEAEPLMRRALAIDEEAYGAEHPDVATVLNNLALLLQATNRLGEAEPLSRRHLLIFLKSTRSTGHEHPRLLAAAGNYSHLLKAMGRSDAEIEAAFQQLFDEANRD